MKYPVVYTNLLMCLLFASCASLPDNALDARPEFRVSTKKQGDKVSVLAEDSQTVIEIYSETGIGSAGFELISGAMPKYIVLRLHLRGLEEFRLISSQVVVAASISSSGVLNTNHQRIISSNLEFPILSVHPLWLNIEIISNSTKIPLEDGYFEITLPAEFLREAGTSFEIQWIDFYR